jgi:hypothetical protein
VPGVVGIGPIVKEVAQLGDFWCDKRWGGTKQNLCSLSHKLFLTYNLCLYLLLGQSWHLFEPQESQMFSEIIAESRLGYLNLSKVGRC